MGIIWNFLSWKDPDVNFYLKMIWVKSWIFWSGILPACISAYGTVFSATTHETSELRRNWHVKKETKKSKKQPIKPKLKCFSITVFCCCCRAINGCNLNVSARRTRNEQSNHSLTSKMKHPLLSSLSQSLYSIAFTRWHPAKHNPCSQHSGVQGLKVTWHHWPSSIWTLLCYTTLTLAVFRAEKKCGRRQK